MIARADRRKNFRFVFIVRGKNKSVGVFVVKGKVFLSCDFAEQIELLQNFLRLIERKIRASPAVPVFVFGEAVEGFIAERFDFEFSFFHFPEKVRSRERGVMFGGGFMAVFPVRADDFI